MIYLNSIPIEEKEKMGSTQKSVIHCSYQILPGRHGKYSQPVSKVLSGRSSLADYAPGVLTSQSERFLFHYLWDATEADEGT